jgi:hypothetical protein
MLVKKNTCFPHPIRGRLPGVRRAARMRVGPVVALAAAAGGGDGKKNMRRC